MNARSIVRPIFRQAVSSSHQKTTHFRRLTPSPANAKHRLHFAVAGRPLAGNGRAIPSNVRPLMEVNEACQACNEARYLISHCPLYRSGVRPLWSSEAAETPESTTCHCT